MDSSLPLKKKEETAQPTHIPDIETGGNTCVRPYTYSTHPFRSTFSEHMAGASGCASGNSCFSVCRISAWSLASACDRDDLVCPSFPKMATAFSCWWWVVVGGGRRGGEEEEEEEEEEGDQCGKHPQYTYVGHSLRKNQYTPHPTLLHTPIHPTPNYIQAKSSQVKDAPPAPPRGATSRRRAATGASRASSSPPGPPAVCVCVFFLGGEKGGVCMRLL
jgi:hypothetical protein